jgi:hypothetical protein
MDWKRCAAMGLLLLATGCGGEKGKKVSQADIWAKLVTYCDGG